MKGVYILLLRVNESIEINVGSLGKTLFNKGTYAYIGSAQNNLEKRVNRHLRKNKKIHWHIDYLTTNENVKIIKILYKQAEKEWECRIAKELIKTEKSINKFGSTDCNCKSHLFKLNNLKEINKLSLKKL